MDDVTCVSESVYGGALTRGRRYSVLNVGADKRQIRIRGDNGRTRWFPVYCFDRGDRPAPTLVGFHLDDSISLAEHLAIHVTVQLSNGDRRWCSFATPAVLARCGDWVDGTEVPFHYGNRHLIIAGELSEELIGRMLRHIDGQGELAECSLPLEGDCGDWGAS